MLGRKNKRPVTADAAMMRMADLCARSEQCSYDILAKLRKLGLSAGESTAVVDRLVEEGFINDRRYAAAFANDKLKFAGWGPVKIRMGLYAKRLPGEMIDEIVGSLPEELVLQTAMKGGEVKARSLDLGLREDCARLLRHLASRGFSPAIARKVLDDIRRR